jgi:signal transduction histidine kinase
MIWGERNPRGEIVMTFWETDWNEVLNERRAAFTMAASHEMRDPLTTLRGFSEILNMDTSNLTPDQAEAAAIIESTARHLTVLVDDVFDLSRNSFGELRLNLGVVDLAETVDSVVSTLRPRIEDREQILHCEMEAGLPEIVADAARATQMVSNLISNASIHNPRGTVIEVKVSTVDDRIAVAVADDGNGLPFERPEEAFHSFRRGHAATAGDRTGSGIGLAITKRLIQLHRGEVTVQSRRGAGSCFTLLFPVDRETALRPDRPGPV